MQNLPIDLLQIDARIAQTASDVVGLSSVQVRGGNAIMVLRSRFGTEHTISHLNAI